MQAVGRWARQVNATTGNPEMKAIGSWARLVKASPGKSIEVGSDGKIPLAQALFAEYIS